jgi:hypothetical protein
MTVGIEGMDKAESAAIMTQLYYIGERREFIYGMSGSSATS